MYIFLDIDGVMVSGATWKQPEILEDGFPNFTTQSKHSLNKVLSLTNVTLILTTSHKHRYTIKQWHEIFGKRGIKITKGIERLPENSQHLNRKEEILKWLKNNPLPENNFIIIDDDKSLNALPKNIKDRLILTSSTIGLTDYLTTEIIELLNKK